ncbi:hypothetical protein HY484_02465 [Candidatus Woesearchaeota archaeon]|nr:hypothetical protein [Candidatus Woesearchaeota archaeon]
MVKKWAHFKSGKLGGWSKILPQTKRRFVLEKLVRRDSYATVVRRLLQLRNVTKDKETITKATSDMRHLKKKFRDNSFVHRRNC